MPDTFFIFTIISSSMLCGKYYLHVLDCLLPDSISIVTSNRSWGLLSLEFSSLCDSRLEFTKEKSFEIEK